MSTKEKKLDLPKKDTSETQISQTLKNTKLTNYIYKTKKPK